MDLSLLDLSDSGESLTIANFDTETRWPGAGLLPAGFDPLAILELGKDPGLGVRRLHAQGITGRNVGIAIIDQTLLVDHVEYADRLQVYEEADDIQGGWLQPQIHGPAVASIAVGRTVGVAPEADLYYIATAMCNTGSHEFDRLRLPGGSPSIAYWRSKTSCPPTGRSACCRSPSDGLRATRATRRSGRRRKRRGTPVCWSSARASRRSTASASMAWGECRLPIQTSSSSYGPGVWWAEEFYAGNAPADALLVPMGSRTTASPAGIEGYAFYSPGGWSWSIPYIAGAYALAAQVSPDITPDVFWSTALRTGTTIEIDHEGQTFSLGPILNPEALIAALRAP